MNTNSKKFNVDMNHHSRENLLGLQPGTIICLGKYYHDQTCLLIGPLRDSLELTNH